MPITPTLDWDYGSWNIVWDDVPNTPAALSDADVQDRIIAAAEAMMWVMTGRQFGLHSTTQPLCLRCGHNNAPLCGCYWYDHIDLDPQLQQPVVSVESVDILGVPLDPAVDFMVMSNRWLYRLPRNERWPVCQDVGLEPPPLVVSWTWGHSPPKDFLWLAVYPFIVQLAKAYLGMECQIDPSYVSSVQREGVSFALIQPSSAWENGMTGHPGIDAAITRAWPWGLKTQVPNGFFDPARFNEFSMKREHS